jgi:mRNA-degrading endonuclease YafQ of YafQ-DinJ toxin-antitoxin module
MRDYKFTKQAFKTLTNLSKNAPKIASHIKEIITNLVTSHYRQAF